jgi:hypothetical protein
MTRRGTFGGFGLASLLYIAAVVVFVLAAFGVDVGDDISLTPLGLAFFAAAHVA